MEKRYYTDEDRNKILELWYVDGLKNMEIEEKFGYPSGVISYALQKNTKTIEFGKRFIERVAHYGATMERDISFIKRKFYLTQYPDDMILGWISAYKDSRREQFCLVVNSEGLFREKYERLLQDHTELQSEFDFLKGRYDLVISSLKKLCNASNDVNSQNV